MELSMVSPIVVFSRSGLRAAPDNKRDKISSFHCYEPNGVYLGLDLSLLCFEP